jgi:hypothetical protein
MSWDCCGWFLGTAGEAVRKLCGSLLGKPAAAPNSGGRGKPDKG